MGDAAVDVECSGVIAAPVAVLALVAIGAATRIDDLRIDRADVLEVDLQLLPRCGQIVGEEDIGILAQLIDQRLTFRRSDIDADAPLALVGVLYHRIDHRIEGDAGDLAHAALRIAAHRVFHLDHVRTPFRQHRASGGHEDELGHFDDLDAFHDLGHRARFLPAAGVRRLRPWP